MRNINYQVLDYKEIHPIRFWVILMGLIVLFVLSAFIFNKILSKYKHIQLEGHNTESEIKKQDGKNPLNFLNNNRILKRLIIGQLVIILALSSLIPTYNNSAHSRAENPSISSSEYLFGIDLSHYQGKIDWNEMRTSHHPIEYIFIRSTMGTNGKDMRFKENWEKAKQHNYIRGAYHYYRPNENSTKQFENYKSAVKIKKGDFIPILDIEKESKLGRENLREGVLNWLKLAEQEYGVKPMIYTGLKFYQHVLKGYVDDYPLWIAAYSGKHRLKNEKWTFHQFTEKVKVKGIGPTVDGNDFKGEIEDLKEMCKK
jgi:GH25 family lysozyme M1 (1,4-beta-N-acetylmuramidase)